MLGSFMRGVERRPAFAPAVLLGRTAQIGLALWHVFAQNRADADIGPSPAYCTGRLRSLIEILDLRESDFSEQCENFFWRT